MGFIPNEIIDAVIDRNDIVAVIGRFVALKKAGRNFKALCPFHHEKSPSFVVNPDKQIFHCFGCGAGGNVIGFVMRQERLEFPQAVRVLADAVGIVVPEDRQEANAPSRQLRDEVFKVNEEAARFFHEQLLSSRTEGAKIARDYLKNRGVNLDAAKTFLLGYAPDGWQELFEELKKKGYSQDLLLQAGLLIEREDKKGCYDRFRNRVIFPVFDIQSRIVAFGARSLKEDDGAKYINSPATPVYTKGRHMYGLHLTKGTVGDKDEVLVVEGYMDMIMPYCHGVNHIAASLGTALTPEQIRLIRRYTPNVVMLFDTDPAGQNAIIRSLDLLVAEGMHVRVATLAADEDPDSFIRSHGVQAFHERLAQAMPLFDFKLQWLKQKFDANSIEGKAEICQAMLETIARYDNEVIKSELVKKLHVVLDIDAQAVMKQLKGIPMPKDAAAKEPIAPAVKITMKDELFLGLLLSNPNWIKQLASLVDANDFAHPIVQEIIKEILVLSQVSEDWLPADVLARTNNPQAQEVVSRLVSKDDSWLGDKEVLFNDLRMRLEKRRIAKEIEDVKKSGDISRLDELLKKMKA